MPQSHPETIPRLVEHPLKPRQRPKSLTRLTHAYLTRIATNVFLVETRMTFLALARYPMLRRDSSMIVKKSAYRLVRYEDARLTTPYTRSSQPSVARNRRLFCAPTRKG